MFNLVSLDGYFAGEDGNIDWHLVDDEFNQFAVEETKSFGGFIFGRTTYQLFESYWPGEAKNPNASSDDREIAQSIDDGWKFVFSKTLTDKDITWKNTKLLHEVNASEVTGWKHMDGKDLVIYGSGQIVQEFTKHGLIDEYRVMVNPVVLGKGKPLFTDPLKLTLLSSREFKNGNVLLTYEPKK